MRVVWMIINGKRPELECAYQWQFEKEDKVKSQKLYLTFYSKKDAQRWMDKWLYLSNGYKIVRAELEFTI